STTLSCVFFFFQAEDGIRDFHVTGVQTCALPISGRWPRWRPTPPPQPSRSCGIPAGPARLPARTRVRLSSLGVAVAVQTVLRCRSEERRVGKECRSRRRAQHETYKDTAARTAAAA